MSQTTERTGQTQAAEDIAALDRAREVVDRLEPSDLAKDPDEFDAVTQLHESIDHLVWAVTLGKPRFRG